MSQVISRKRESVLTCEVPHKGHCLIVSFEDPDQESVTTEGTGDFKVSPYRDFLPLLPL